MSEQEEEKIISGCVTCKAYDKCFASMLSKAELAEFEKELTSVVAKHDEVIFSENKHANKIYVLLEGDVKLEHKNALEQPVIMRIAHCCESMGLETMLSERHYLMTAVAVTDAVCCAIPKSNIENFVVRNKAACSKLMEQMQNEQERIYKHSLLMISGSSESKLAQALLSLSNKAGVVRISKEDIALMTGLTRETISRILSRMNSKKIIETKQREVIILNRTELEKLTGNMKHNSD